MVRAYRVKPNKKRKNREEKYDKEVDEVNDTSQSLPVESKDRVVRFKAEKTIVDSENETHHDEKEVQDDELEGIPLVPSEPNSRKPDVVFVLEKASLEVGKVGKNYQILSSEDHTNFLRRNNKNPADYRPDIVYQALLSILDSPLNKAGRVRAVYVKTEKGVLFEVKPHVRIPRTYKRFAGIMLQLLQKLSITAVNKREKLLRVIKNPVTQYLPVNSRKIGFSYSSDKLVEMTKYVDTYGSVNDLVFVVGAMAHGKIDVDYIDDFIAISGYPLSAAWCIARICEAVAQKWSIV